MSISIRRYFDSKTFEPGALEGAIRDLCISLNVKPESINGRAEYRYADGFKEDKEITIADLGLMVLLETHPENVTLAIGDTLFISMSCLGERLRLNAMGEDART